jgi:hypothetical protein
MIDTLGRVLTQMQDVLADATVALSDGGSTVGGGVRFERDVQARVDEWAQVVLASQRVINAASAVQAVALAGVGALDEVQSPDGSWVGVEQAPGFVGEFAAVTVAPMLGLTSRGAEDRVQAAAALVSRLPGTLAAMAPVSWTPGGPRSSQPRRPRPPRRGARGWRR